MKWTEQGVHPDYRFSLANERTYLAWIRTALAFLAAAIGIDQLTPDLASAPVRDVLSLGLCLMSAYFSLMAYRRWRSNEQAMRHQQALTYTSNVLVMMILMVVVVIVIMTVIAV